MARKSLTTLELTFSDGKMVVIRGGVLYQGRASFIVIKSFQLPFALVFSLKLARDL